MSRQPDHPDLGDHVTEGPIVFRSPPIGRVTSTLSSGCLAVVGGFFAGALCFLLTVRIVGPLVPRPGGTITDWIIAIAVIAFLLVAEAIWIATARLAPTRVIVDGQRVWFGRRFLGAWDDVARISLIDLDDVEDVVGPTRRAVSITFGPRTRRTIILRMVDADALVALLQLRSRRAGVWREDGAIELPEAATDAAAANLAIRSRLRRRMIGTTLLGLLFTGFGAGGLVATTTSPPASNGRRAWNFTRSTIAIVMGALSFHHARVLQRSLRDNAHDGDDGELDDGEGDDGESDGHHDRGDDGYGVR